MCWRVMARYTGLGRRVSSMILLTDLSCITVMVSFGLSPVQMINVLFRIIMLLLTLNDN